MLEIGSAVANVNRVMEKGGTRETNINLGFGFSDVLKEIGDRQLIVVGSDQSGLLSFRKREEEVAVETKVPAKESENIFDVIAEIRRLVEDLE